MNPITIINEALAALNGILNIIATLKSQGGLTDDQILAAAATQQGANADQIKTLLANLPAATPPAS
jgi:hypothetical protein